MFSLVLSVPGMLLTKTHETSAFIEVDNFTQFDLEWVLRKDLLVRD